MPFDALVMRALEKRWQDDLVPTTCTRIQCGRERILFSVKVVGGRPQNILMVLQPGLQRIHRTQLSVLPLKASTFPWLSKILPFTMRAVHVPAFERIMVWTIEYAGEWGETVSAQLIVELAGHLTNLILVDTQGLVVDAWRKFAPGRPGRTIWPNLPYQPPTPPANPFLTHNLADLPPWAKQWVAQGGQWQQLEQDWHAGFPHGSYLLSSRLTEEVWLYPLAGYVAQPQADLERALDITFERRERARQESELKSQLLALIQRRLAHLSEKLSQYRMSQTEDPEHWKTVGDLWLAYQHRFAADSPHRTITVPDFDNVPVDLTLPENQTPVDCAQSAYRRYKKLKARQGALQRLIPVLERECLQLQTLHDEVASQESHPLDWYRTQLSHTQRASSGPHPREPFRHFQSVHGLDIWVGRNRDENARLTFQMARPDDIWLHTKQAPGSHVILSTGKSVPDHADLLDAAELAVFFSKASASSQVPVDYTRKKFVRKRPHAAPGQVLYQREKTLYITPDPERLRRLGAVSEKLVDD